MVDFPLGKQKITLNNPGIYGTIIKFQGGLSSKPYLIRRGQSSIVILNAVRKSTCHIPSGKQTVRY